MVLLIAEANKGDLVSCVEIMDFLKWPKHQQKSLQKTYNSSKIRNSSRALKNLF